MVSLVLPPLPSLVCEVGGTVEPHVADTTAKYTEHQIIVMVGETGSGKTTQYAQP
jgi:flagellar biosynthesis GTPase FlhF